MHRLPETLRHNVRSLGELLGNIVRLHEGDGLFEQTENIRNLSKTLAQSDAADYQPLVDALRSLSDRDILPVARAFNQFLNLANIADQQYYSSTETQEQDSLQTLLSDITHSISTADPDANATETLLRTVRHLNIDLVLTAHPTEISRRTLIYKYNELIATLGDFSRIDLLAYQKDKLRGRLYRIIEEIWTTDEIRIHRPTAVDEARGGLSVIETSLWSAVPDFIRHLDRVCRQELGDGLTLETKPFTFGSWMGGDRDGNPNVTHDVTEKVVLLGRQKAAELYLSDIDKLISSLSMHTASAELKSALTHPDSPTPYRDLLQDLRHRLQDTIEWTQARIESEPTALSTNILNSSDDILAPLLLAHRSLIVCECPHIANGPLIDTIRRVYAFGLNLSPLDIRQDAERHVLALDEITQYLELGSYLEWTEKERMTFLLNQLQSRRPLLPRTWPVSEDTQEVLDTCRVIAELPRETLSNYVISMAKHSSDVLAVALLLKESGVSWDMPIVPLFETLDDLNRSSSVMHTLWQTHWYREYCQGRQTVMIGYSDSAKDAGKLAATWAQYRAQEKLVSLAEQCDISMTLFHGRGGTVGRGGGPVEKAMASQPPGSVKGRIRVTEQGEMIRYKFGMPAQAFNSLRIYAVATLKATLRPSPAPKPEWRQLMDDMAQESLYAYRAVVRENPDFVPYFRSLTPEQELGKLAIGSRPAKRKASGGVESLRAIPWVFAWMQVRLNLPSWLGVYQALAYADQNKPELLRDMLDEWSFFSSFIELLEMVLGKADNSVCAHYEKQLVSPEYHSLGEQLRQDLNALSEKISAIKNQSSVLASDPTLYLSIEIRKPYVDPLNYLQAELLRREREAGEMSAELERALKVTMAGISAGMRNTG